MEQPTSHLVRAVTIPRVSGRLKFETKLEQNILSSQYVPVHTEQSHDENTLYADLSR